MQQAKFGQGRAGVSQTRPTAPERRQLIKSAKQKALTGDTVALLALSNFLLADEIKKGRTV